MNIYYNQFLYFDQHIAFVKKFLLLVQYYMILLNFSIFVLFEDSDLYSDIIIIISFGKTDCVKIFLIELSKCLKCLKNYWYTISYC